jgi:regulator of replication initiation timing
MSKIIKEIKFQFNYYRKNISGAVAAYLSDLGSALIGRTRKQAEYLNKLLSSSLSRLVSLAAENAELKRELDKLKAKKPTAKKKPRPSKGE